MSTTTRIDLGQAYGELPAALLERLFQAWPLMAGMSVLGPLALASVLAPYVAAERLWPWFGLSELVGVAAVALGLSWRRFGARYVAQAAVCIALGNGLLAGLLMPLFFSRDSLVAGLLPAAVCAVAGSATITLQAHRPAMIALIAGSLGPMLVWAVWFAPEARLTLAGLIGLYAAMLVAYGLHAHASLRELLALRLENRRLLIESEQRRHRAELADAAKTRFLAAASHDLRQPLSALSLQIDALTFSADDTHRGKLERLQYSVQSLIDLLNGLLDLSRLDAPGFSIQVQSVNLAVVLDDLYREFLPVAAAKQLTLRLRRPARLTLATDPILLTRAVRNLLSNALRYTAKGGVLLAAKQYGKRVRIAVIDTGQGIAKHDQARVFEEYFQVDGRADASGLGLGLALVRRITESLQGEVSLRSLPGRGSRFLLTLPQLALPQAALPPPSPNLDDGLKDCRILVIEDEPENRHALHALLQTFGCAVIAAETLEAALVAMVDAREPPDLLLTDYRLPCNTNGVDAIERIRDEFNRPLPAVLLSADHHDQGQSQVAASGVTVLQKPVSALILRAALAAALGKRT